MAFSDARVLAGADESHHDGVALDVVTVLASGD
jgi:hypothetical protein